MFAPKRGSTFRSGCGFFTLRRGAGSVAARGKGKEDPENNQGNGQQNNAARTGDGVIEVRDEIKRTTVVQNFGVLVFHAHPFCGSAAVNPAFSNTVP